MELWHALSGVVVGLGLGLVLFALTRLPRTPIAPLLYAFVGAGALWAIGNSIADTTSDIAWKQAGVALLYTGSITLPALWWAIVLGWADEERAGLPLRGAIWRLVPFGFAGSMWLVMITNPWHGMFLDLVLGGRNVYQPLWYAMAIPNYALIVAAFAVELAVVFRVPRREVRRQGAFLISASLVTLLGNASYVSGLVSLDPTSVVLSVSGTLLVIGMAREGLFGVLPAALPKIAAEHPDGLVVVGPDGNVRFANARAHLLLAPIDVRPSASFVDTLRDERLRPESSELIDRGTGEPWEMLGRDGGVVFRLDAERPQWLHVSASLVHGRRGQTVGHCVRIADLTDRKQAELQVRQTRRLESVADLTRTLSRQFQGAFALVENNAELLLSGSGAEGSGEEASSERKLARIAEAARYGLKLAQQLQLYAGSVSTTRVVLELSEVVHESCDLVEPDLSERVRLLLVRSDTLLPVYVDAIQLRHCVFELLMNAIEAMDDGEGEIHVWTGTRRIDPARMSLVWGVDQPAGEFAYVRVRDEGGGMEPETQERAFEPFFSTRGKDRGDGLPTVLGIARAHGALVALENRSRDGCDFVLYFPLESDA